VARTSAPIIGIFPGLVQAAEGPRLEPDPEAGYPQGFKATLFYCEYFPQMTSQIQLVQQDLKRNLNIELTITKNDYTSYFGRYADGKWDGTAWGFQTGYAVSLDERTYQ
jgi:hypothetical protein